MLDVPTGRYAIIWYVLTLPLLLCFHYTLLDVRLPGNNIYYGRMILLCVFYLAVFSYIMILCCDEIGNFIGTTPTVMGLTLAAVGTSFPNLWASMIVARQGYGNMAICNALGSNIFNVDVALGGPWFVFLLIRGGKPYQDMKDHGIVMFVVMLLAVCVIWLGMIVSRGFKMEAWMAPIFVLIYLAVIVAAVFLS
ncbi:Sodium/calcium exchanger protein-domain-containing protein [Ochromonadaceae sp. CCMP2298]|nr:Sodium/calcium exchanger protein-domain-containing protein [Ochromonadaceae sp. CCMP2298]